MKSYFEKSDSIYQITTKYPETISMLVSHGLDKIKNEIIRTTDEERSLLTKPHEMDKGQL